MSSNKSRNSSISVTKTNHHNNRHTKQTTRNAGEKNTKRPYDRSVNRQVDQKLERKGHFFTYNPEDELSGSLDAQSHKVEGYTYAPSEDECKEEQYDVDGYDEATRRLLLELTTDAIVFEVQREILCNKTNNHFPSL